MRFTQQTKNKTKKLIPPCGSTERLPYGTREWPVVKGRVARRRAHSQSRASEQSRSTKPSAAPSAYRTLKKAPRHRSLTARCAQRTRLSAPGGADTRTGAPPHRLLGNDGWRQYLRPGLRASPQAPPNHQTRHLATQVCRKDHCRGRCVTTPEEMSVTQRDPPPAARPPPHTPPAGWWPTFGMSEVWSGTVAYTQPSTGTWQSRGGGRAEKHDSTLIAGRVTRQVPQPAV